MIETKSLSPSELIVTSLGDVPASLQQNSDPLENFSYYASANADQHGVIHPSGFRSVIVADAAGIHVIR